MNTPTIEMERDVALEKLGEYETAMQRNPRLATQIDRDVMRGYRVLAKGGRLVDVNAAIKHAGLNLAGQPKLAIARANAEDCHWIPTTEWIHGVGSQSDGGCRFAWVPRTRMTDDRVRWIMPPLTFDGRLSKVNAKAMSPLIPLPHRPKHALENYFLLWEANWHPAPPIDPYLLRPITGSLMEIIAEWDVSPLELAAVSAAMRSR